MLAFVAEGPDGGVAYSYECHVSGELVPNDPDGIIRRVEWVPRDQALARLAAFSWYDGEPLRGWLQARRMSRG
jgi:hypothetical protein